VSSVFSIVSWWSPNYHFVPWKGFWTEFSIGAVKVNVHRSPKNCRGRCCSSPVSEAGRQAAGDITSQKPTSRQGHPQDFLHVFKPGNHSSKFLSYIWITKNPHPTIVDKLMASLLNFIVMRLRSQVNCKTRLDSCNGMTVQNFCSTQNPGVHVPVWRACRRPWQSAAIIFWQARRLSSQLQSITALGR